VIFRFKSLIFLGWEDFVEIVVVQQTLLEHAQKNGDNNNETNKL